MRKYVRIGMPELGNRRATALPYYEKSKGGRNNALFYKNKWKFI